MVDVNVDYILLLFEKHRTEHGDGDDKELKESIFLAVDASPSPRYQEDLIEDFVDAVPFSGEIESEWQTFVRGRQTRELDEVIAAEHLTPEPTHDFVEREFPVYAVQTTGTKITQMFAPVSRVAADS